MEILGLDMIKKEPDEVNITGLDKIKQIFHNDLPKMSPFAVELISLVNRLKELDDALEEFGATEHGYEFNPVLSLSKVRDFERRHQLTLPQDYVDFLTQVGNGGAGPAYGFFSLEEVENRNHYADILTIFNYGCGRFGTLAYDGEHFGKIGYIDTESPDEMTVKDMTFEEFALKWAKETIKKYEN